jgi:ribosome biogenesis GTPase
MPDLRAHLGQCRFYNCTHLHEPGCAVLQAVGDSPEGIAPSRHRIYKDLFEELSQPRY